MHSFRRMKKIHIVTYTLHCLYLSFNFSHFLQAIWPYSGHYLPTEDNFKEFISFLEEHHVELSNVKVITLQYILPCINIC